MNRIIQNPRSKNQDPISNIQYPRIDILLSGIPESALITLGLDVLHFGS
jgi:hypothetical protein